MKRDYKLYLSDILNAIESIEKFTEGMSFDEFREDSAEGYFEFAEGLNEYITPQEK